LYRLLIVELSLEHVGLWSILTATLSLGRIGEGGVAASIVRHVARALGEGNTRLAAMSVWVGTVVAATVLGVLLPTIGFFVVPVVLASLPNAGLAMEGQAVVSFLLLAYWINAIAISLLSTAEGAQRFGLKAIVSLTSQAAFTAFAYWLIPVYGFRGLATAFVGQALLLLILAVAVAFHLVPLVRPAKPQRAQILDMINYGVNVQIGGIAQLLFEPVTKLALGIYGGMAFLGQFEMANRLVQYLRSLIVAGVGPLAPTVASTSPDRAPTTYVTFYRLLAFCAPVAFGIATALMPIISWLWLGNVAFAFVFAGAIASVAWGINSIAAAAYMTNLGSGHPERNLIHHVLAGVLNLSLVLTLGAWFDGNGVLIGTMLALVISSIWLIADFHKRNHLSSLQDRQTVALTLTAIVLGTIVTALTSLDFTDSRPPLTIVITSLVAALAVGSVGAHHPIGRRLPSQLRDALARKK
jgi:O-antigen/teichoic acid export membrane protein